jgi:hypothetical protein
MRERLPDYDIVASPADAPIVLAGPPGRLSGRLALHNTGETRVVLRQASLRDVSGALGDRPVQHSFHPVVLHPAQGRTMPLRLAIDPATPPGEYHCELEVAGRTRPAVLHVVEAFTISVSPSVVVVENRPGEVQRKQLVVTNDGNVGITVGDIGDVVLEDDMIWCRAERAAIGPWMEKNDPRLEELVVAVLKAARDEAYRSGNLLVRNLAGEVDLPAGATVTIDLEITVPERLHRNSRYKGVTPLFTEDLVFLVVPARGAGVGHAPAPEPKATTATLTTAKATATATKAAAAKATTAKKATKATKAAKRPQGGRP